MLLAQSCIGDFNRHPIDQNRRETRLLVKHINNRATGVIFDLANQLAA